MSRALIAAVICTFAQVELNADEQVYRKGEWVTVIVRNTQFERDGQRFGHAQLGDTLQVGEQRGEFLWIPSVEGKLKAAEVVPYSEAIAHFTKIVDRSPDDAWSYFARAVFFVKSKAPNRALVDADRAIELSNDRAELYICRGNILRDLGRFEKAIEDFDVAIQLNPDDINGWNGRGLALSDLMQYEGAIKDFTHAIDLNPNASYAWSNRGLAYAGLHRYDQALSDFSSAIRLAPDDPVPFRNRADAHWDQGHWSAAFEDYASAIERPTLRSQSFISRGNRYTEIGFYREALIDYAAAIRDDLLGSEAFAARGWLLATCPDPQFRDAHQALLDGNLACDRTDFRNPRALRTYAAALADLGRYEEAIKWQNAAVRFVSYRYDVPYRRIAGYYARHEPYRLPRPKPRPPVEAERP